MAAGAGGTDWPWPAGPSSKRRDQQIYYQYRADQARRTLRGIDEQVAKAVAGLAPVKRNPVHGPRRRGQERQPRTRSQGQDPGRPEGHVTNLAASPDGTPVTADFAIASYHRLFDRSGCPRATCRPAPSTIASATP
jgi:hypothetical protein